MFIAVLICSTCWPHVLSTAWRTADLLAGWVRRGCSPLDSSSYLTSVVATSSTSGHPLCVFDIVQAWSRSTTCTKVCRHVEIEIASKRILSTSEEARWRGKSSRRKELQASRINLRPNESDLWYQIFLYSKLVYC